MDEVHSEGVLGTIHIHSVQNDNVLTWILHQNTRLLTNSLSFHIP